MQGPLTSEQISTIIAQFQANETTRLRNTEKRLEEAQRSASNNEWTHKLQVHNQQNQQDRQCRGDLAQQLSRAMGPEPLSNLMSGCMYAVVTPFIKSLGDALLPRVYGQIHALPSVAVFEQHLENFTPNWWRSLMEQIQAELDTSKIQAQVVNQRVARFEAEFAAQLEAASNPSAQAYDALVTAKTQAILTRASDDAKDPQYGLLRTRRHGSSQEVLLARAAAVEQVELDLLREKTKLEIDQRLSRNQPGFDPQREILTPPLLNGFPFFRDAVIAMEREMRQYGQVSLAPFFLGVFCVQKQKVCVRLFFIIRKKKNFCFSNKAASFELRFMRKLAL